MTRFTEHNPHTNRALIAVCCLSAAIVLALVVGMAGWVS